LNFYHIFFVSSKEELILNEGYPFEKHFVPTEDGYTLEMHRIPYGKDVNEGTKIPIILQHGNFLSSADWLLNTHKNNSFGTDLLIDTNHETE